MKAKDINKAINWISGAAAAYFIGTAIAGAIKKRKATNGIGATDGDYLIKAYWEDGRYSNERIFCGYTYDRWSGEKWAKWVNPYARWFEYDFKYYKTIKGAEKAIQELIRLGENEWNGYPVKLSVIEWDEIRF